jgi:hypothetical protein
VAIVLWYHASKAMKSGFAKAACQALAYSQPRRLKK